MSPEEAVEVALGDSGLDRMADPADIIAALRAVRYVVVELPDPNPNGVRRHPSWRVVVDGEPEDVYIRREINEPDIEVVVSGVASLTVAESRALAAALLAAADAAEAS